MVTTCHVDCGLTSGQINDLATKSATRWRKYKENKKPLAMKFVVGEILKEAQYRVENDDPKVHAICAELSNRSQEKKKRNRSKRAQGTFWKSEPEPEPPKPLPVVIIDSAPVRRTFQFGLFTQQPSTVH